MLALLPIILLLLTPGVMLVIRILRPGFTYFWLVAAASSSLVWVMVLVLGFQLPQTLRLLEWNPEALFPASPTLLADPTTWPYAFAVATLALSVILTGAARFVQYSWKTWASTLTLAGLGILAIFSGNLLTLLLAWAAIDLIELIILFIQVDDSSDRERAVISFSARVAGIILLLWAGLVGAPGDPFIFTDIPAEASVYLLLAAGLRLGVLPLHLPFAQELPLRRGLGSMLRLAPAASSLMLLTRAAAVGVAHPLQPILFTLVCLAVIYGAFGWLTASDELRGRPYWILGMASLAVASAAKGHPQASQAWGLVCLLTGGLLFLSSAKYRGLLIIFILGILGITGLPFTPAWDGAHLYSAPFDLYLPVFLIGQAILLTGYLRHALAASTDLSGSDRWIRSVYPLGLGLLPLSHYLIAWRTPLPGDSTGNYAEWWAGPSVLFLTALLVYIGQRDLHLPSGIVPIWNRLFSLNWMTSLAWGIYRSIGRLIAIVTNIMEGEGGVLWAMVLLVILVSLLAQSGLGG
jgi:hypothetical protein